jgi:outer membrane protein assembly factor BamB
MIKLDPSRPGDPLVWKVHDRHPVLAGVFGSPALYQDIAIFDTHRADVLGIDRATGAVRWRLHLREATWQSPVVVDGVLLIGDCGGDLHAYDVTDTHSPPRHLWTLKIGGCIESTPAVWNGIAYVGTRAGGFHAVGLP